ncbi:MAG: bifunctional helix-turn-helix transcriptional regulator/GNAT family N-acetyltransferase [Alphaproteobacteria bacterium]|nr:bifunctional helix-turn-helix transcriptional regulator/GNAT family N-acetyltransferase [Alphaproteobacteria bacterium]
MSTADITSQILAIRHFNRFYTRHFGLLQKRLLDSPYSLVEARVLYDLANHAPLTAKEIAIDLMLDAGYLSRILKRFETEGLLTRERCTEDGRSQQLGLTPKGMGEAQRMADLANAEVQEMIQHLGDDARNMVIKSMQTVEATLKGYTPQKGTAVIRSHRPGDIGWVISAHGKMYAEEYGFNEKFEALVARIATDFINDYDPTVEHCWIAELDGKNVGSIFLVREDDKVARLRLLLLLPQARGLGLGAKLVDECIRFARQAGYETVDLWTNAALKAAGHIYQSAGFKLVSEDTHSDFGPPQVGQNWRLKL